MYLEPTYKKEYSEVREGAGQLISSSVKENSIWTTAGEENKHTPHQYEHISKWLYRNFITDILFSPEQGISKDYILSKTFQNTTGWPLLLKQTGPTME